MSNRMPDDEWSGLVRRQRQVHTENSLRITQVGAVLEEAQRARDSEADLLHALKGVTHWFVVGPVGDEDADDLQALYELVKAAIDKAEARDERG